MRMGIIAEDHSDVAVVREFTLILLKPRVVGFKHFVGDGCGKLRRKCGAWARILVQQGCPWIVVIHDLDDFDEHALRSDLEETIAAAHAKASVVLIPKREIEAWLLYDAEAIAKAFRERKNPKLPGNPEELLDPKKYMRDLIWKSYRKEYLNTLHNQLIARHVHVSALSRCDSFQPHITFTKSLKKVTK